eukprot:scaffold50093_cov23-Tisochrysis_lutea.AAC.1
MQVLVTRSTCVQRAKNEKASQGLRVSVHSCVPRSHIHTRLCTRTNRRTLLPQHPEVLVVENTLTDARFKDNALVAGPPGIRFYAGCPLVASNKMRYGSL